MAGEEGKQEQPRGIPILDPTPDRKRRLVEILLAYLDDKISFAELKGISREQMFQLADAGFVKFKHGRVEEAKKIYQALVMLDNRNYYFHAVMGAIYMKLNHPIEAIMELSRAVMINDKDISSFVNRGEIYLRARNYRKAAEDFRNAIMLDMSGRNLWANRARSLVIALKRQIELDRAKGKEPLKAPPPRPAQAASSPSPKPNPTAKSSKT